MKSKKIFIFVGHPSKTNPFCELLADSYKRGAEESGHEVRMTKLADMEFDPILHEGYKMRQAYEPDLIKFQEDVRWAEHIFLIHPTWWYNIPALLKGLIDRVWMPGFGYKFGKSGLTWKKLLKGRTARLVATTASPWFVGPLLFTDPTTLIGRNIFWFSGIRTRVKRIGRAEKMSEAKRNKWKAKMYRLGLGAK